jgi:hypothetical protein
MTIGRNQSFDLSEGNLAESLPKSAVHHRAGAIGLEFATSGAPTAVK